MCRFFVFIFLFACVLSCQSETKFASVYEIGKLESITTEDKEEVKEEEVKEEEIKEEEEEVKEKEVKEEEVKEEEEEVKEKEVKEEEVKEEEEEVKEKELVFTLKPEEKRKLDILFVLDTSESMDHHLQKLGSRLLFLLESISDYDWQIGFITADHGDHAIAEGKNKNKISSFLEDKWEDHIASSKFAFGKLMPLELEPVQLTDQSWEFNVLDQKILNSKTPNYKNIFFHTVSHYPNKKCNFPPFCQKPMEQPLRSLKSAIERVNLDNKNLFRPGADFVSLIISNEKERLEDTSRATSAQEVVDVFNFLLKPMEKRFFAFNILVLDKDCQKSEHERGGRKALTASLALNNIGKLADLTGGENISICKEDYGPELQKISQVIEIFVEQSLDIPEAFDPSSLQVEFLSGEPVPWELVGNRLIFKEKVKQTKELKVSYLPI